MGADQAGCRLVDTGSCCRANQKMAGSSDELLSVRRYFDGGIFEVIHFLIIGAQTELAGTS
jgi:hypothetical protein